MEQYKNNSSTTLNGTITNSAVSITVTDGSVFPSSGNFRLICEDEYFLATARTGNTLTVVRGAEGSTAVTHVNGTKVTLILTREALINLGSQLVQRGLSLPAASNEGRLYLYNNNPVIERDDGTAWVGSIITGGPALDSAKVATFNTWVNQGSATWTAKARGYNLKVDSTSAGNDLALRVKTQAGGDFFFRACLQPRFNSNSQNGMGLVARDATSGKFLQFVIADHNRTLGVYAMNSPTSYSGSGFFRSVSLPMVMWLAIRRVSSTVSFEYSYDGDEYIPFETLSNYSGHLTTLNSIGFCVDRLGLDNRIGSINNTLSILGAEY